MPQQPDFDQLTTPLAELLTQFLAGGLRYADFLPRFRTALRAYEGSINDLAYWPLGAIAEMPLGVSADLPKQFESELHDYCQQALDRLPKEALDRSTRLWIESTLIEEIDDWTYFSFFNSDGQSLFGTHAAIYSTRIDDDSVLLSALNGTISQSPFRYDELLNVLRDIGGNELATWVYGTEPDNVIASIDRIWSLGDAYEESDQLRQLESHPSLEGGGSYLMLLPKSKQWMLMNEYYYEGFSICLHGNRQFIVDVASRINAEPDWEWRPSDT